MIFQVFSLLLKSIYLSLSRCQHPSSSPLIMHFLHSCLINPPFLVFSLSHHSQNGLQSESVISLLRRLSCLPFPQNNPEFLVWHRRSCISRLLLPTLLLAYRATVLPLHYFHVLYAPAPSPKVPPYLLSLYNVDTICLSWRPSSTSKVLQTASSEHHGGTQDRPLWKHLHAEVVP